VENRPLKPGLIGGLRLRLLKLRVGFSILIYSSEVARVFWRGFDHVSKALSYDETVHWALTGFELTQTRRKHGRAYFQLTPSTIPSLATESRALAFDLLHRAATRYSEVSTDDLRDALEALKQLSESETAYLLLRLCWEVSSSSTSRAFELLIACADTMAQMDLAYSDTRAFLVRALNLLARVSQRSASKAQEFFGRLQPALAAVGEHSDEPSAIAAYDRVLQITDRMAVTSAHLATEFFVCGIELATLKQEHPVERWAELFGLIANPRTLESGNAVLVRDTTSYALMIRTALSELISLASREGDERLLDVVLDTVLRVARRDVEAAFKLLTSSPEILQRMPPESYQQWVEHGLELPGDNSKRLVAYFAYASRLSRETAVTETGAVSLDEALPTIRHYIKALTGKPFTISGAKEIAPLTGISDGKTIDLPAIVKSFDSPTENFRLYKVLAARAAGQLEFGTYDEDTDELKSFKENLESEFRFKGGRRAPPGAVTAKHILGIFPQNKLAERLFAIFEEGRVENRLCQSYRGLARDIAWARNLREHRRPEGIYLLGHEPILELIYNSLLRGEQPDEPDDDDRALLETLNRAYAEFIARPGATVCDSLGATLGIYQHLAPKPPDDSSSVPWKDEKELPPDQDCDQMKSMPRGPSQALGSKDQMVGAETSQTPSFRDSTANGKVAIGCDQPVPEREAEPNVFYYDEWDYSVGDYRVDWCKVKEHDAPRADPSFVSRTRARYSGVLSSIRHQFQMLRPQGLRRVGRQVDGDDFDMQAVLDRVVDCKASGRPDEKIYTQRLHLERDVAVLFLVDMSSSTSRVVDTTLRKVVDVEREALILMSEAIEAVGDSYAIYGFSSHGRNRVSLYKMKRFDEPFNSSVEARIAGIKSLVNTRLGAAIRHATARLAHEPHHTHLLIVLSDGKPSDDDGYELPFYGREDTRYALIEAKRQGITPFCITIDTKEEKDLKRLYGEVGYTVVDDVLSLPERMPGIYRRLTT
jgi:hypothetical protein